MTIDERLGLLLRNSQALRAAVHETYLAAIPEEKRKAAETSNPDLKRPDVSR